MPLAFLSLSLCTRKLCRLTKIAHCYCSFLAKLIRRLRTGLRCSGILQAHTMPQLGGCLLVCGQAWRRVCQHTHTWQAQLRWVYTHTHTHIQKSSQNTWHKSWRHPQWFYVSSAELSFGTHIAKLDFIMQTISSKSLPADGHAPSINIYKCAAYT